MFIFVTTYLGVEDVRLHRSSVSYEELHDVCFEGEIKTRQTINQAYFFGHWNLNSTRVSGFLEIFLEVFQYFAWVLRFFGLEFFQNVQKVILHKWTSLQIFKLLISGFSSLKRSSGETKFNTLKSAGENTDALVQVCSPILSYSDFFWSKCGSQKSIQLDQRSDTKCYK